MTQSRSLGIPVEPALPDDIDAAFDFILVRASGHTATDAPARARARAHPPPSRTSHSKGARLAHMLHTHTHTSTRAERRG